MKWEIPPEYNMYHKSSEMPQKPISPRVEELGKYVGAYNEDGKVTCANAFTEMRGQNNYGRIEKHAKYKPKWNSKGMIEGM